MANDERENKGAAGVVTDISTVDLVRNAADLTNRVEYAGERFRVVRRGKPIAALVSVRDLETLDGAA